MFRWARNFDAKTEQMINQIKSNRSEFSECKEKNGRKACGCSSYDGQMTRGEKLHMKEKAKNAWEYKY